MPVTEFQLGRLVDAVSGQLFAFNLRPFLKSATMDKEALYQEWATFKEKLSSIPFSDDEIEEILRAFIFSYVGHLYADKRKSGEPYFFHPLRCATRIVEDQIKLRIKNKTVVMAVLLHDVIEEADSSDTYFQFYGFLTTSVIKSNFDNELSTAVRCLSKQKWRKEGRLEYLERLIKEGSIEVLWAKCEDIGDNLDTLAWMPVEKQISKLLELKEKISPLLNQFETLVQNGLHNGIISGKGWEKLCERKKRRLIKSITTERERLKQEGHALP